MVGDTNDYVRLLALVKKKVSYCLSLSPISYSNASQKPLEISPSQFIAGSSSGDDSGADLDDDTQICSCHVRHNALHHFLALLFNSGSSRTSPKVR